MAALTGDHHYQYVRAPAEAAMDADVQAGLARMGLQKSNNLNQGMRRYESKEFVARLHAYMLADGGQLDWLNLGKSVRVYYRRAAGLSTMFGPIAVEQKERKAVQRQARDVVDKAIAPDVITNTQTEQSGNETSARVLLVTRALKSVFRARQQRGEDVEFFEFVTNPDSFTQTVENIFHLAFAVRQGFAKMTTAKDGRLLVEPSKPLVGGGAGADGGPSQSNQAVVTMSIALWRRVVKELGLTEPLIVPRAVVSTAEYLPKSVQQDVPDDVDNGTAAANKRRRTQQSQTASQSTRRRRAAADESDEEVEHLLEDDDDADTGTTARARGRKAATAADDDDNDEGDVPKPKKKRLVKKKSAADDDDDE